MNKIPEPSLWNWRCYIVDGDTQVQSFAWDEVNNDSSCVEVPFPENGMLNLYEIKGILPQSGKKLLLTGVFTADEAGTFFAGMAGDGRFLLQMNGNVILDGRQWGNNEFPMQSNSHILEVDYLSGTNRLVFEVPASGTCMRFFWKFMNGMQSLAFRYGPYLSFPDSSENAISILFASNRNSPAAVQYHKKGSNDPWERVYDNLGGQRRRDKAVHHIRLSELEDDCTYEYACVLQDDCRNLQEILSPVGTFHIPGRSEKNFSFLFTADLQNVGSRIPYLERLLGKDSAFKPDFFAFGGDLYWTSNFNLSVMDEFMEPYRKITNGDLPLVMVRGNHEIYGKESNQYFDYFTPPGEGREGYYLFRRGDVCFIVLDFCDDAPWMPPSSTRQFHDFEPYLKAQKKWLKKALQLPVCQEAKFRIVLAHGVPVGDPKEYMPQHIREMILDLFCGKDPFVRIHLWLGGHIHRPLRSIPGCNSCYSVMDPRCLPDGKLPPTGVDYDFPVVVTGGPNGRLSAEMQCTSMRVEVSGEKILVQSFDAMNEPFDTFTVSPDGSVEEISHREDVFKLYNY